MWCIPKVSAAFVACMEDILDLYELPYDPHHPLVCFDETSKQLIEETRRPLPVRPGQAERYDYEYRRRGTRNLFMFFEPLASYRHVEVTQRRTFQDFAHCMQWLVVDMAEPVDHAYPDAHRIRLVLDTLRAAHTKRLRYMRRLNPPKPIAFSNVSSSTTRPNMAVGSTLKVLVLAAWLRSSSVYSVESAWHAESLMKRRSSKRSSPSKWSGTTNTAR